MNKHDELKSLKNGFKEKIKHLKKTGSELKIPSISEVFYPYSKLIEEVKKLLRKKENDEKIMSNDVYNQRDNPVNEPDSIDHQNKKTTWRQTFSFGMISLMYSVEIFLVYTFSYYSLLEDHTLIHAQLISFVIAVITCIAFIVLKALFAKIPTKGLLDFAYGTTIFLCLIAFGCMIDVVIDLRVLEITELSKNKTFAYSSFILAGLLPILWSWYYWGRSNVIELLEKILKAKVQVLTVRDFLKQLEEKNTRENVVSMLLEEAEKTASTHSDLNNYKTKLNKVLDQNGSKDPKEDNDIHFIQPREKENDKNHPIH